MEHQITVFSHNSLQRTFLRKFYKTPVLSLEYQILMQLVVRI